MTTIACNRQELAADSCYTHDDIGIGTGQFATLKIHRIGRSIFGMRGDNTVGQVQALQWIADGRRPSRRPEIPAKADWHLLELSPDGIYLWDQSLDREVVLERTFAIGSGAKVALYCMRELRMTPLKAVEEAAKVDAYTRGPFIVEKLRGR